MSTFVSKSETLGKSLWLAVWVAAMYGSLQLHHIEASFGHAICGPWGCGPPTMALVGYHAFWLLLIVPPAMVASFYLPADRAIRIGSILAILGLGALAWVVIADGINFWQTARGSKYLLQRILFRVATFVDFPLGPLGLAGLAMRWLGLRRIRSDYSSPAEETL